MALLYPLTSTMPSSPISTGARLRLGSNLAPSPASPNLNSHQINGSKKKTLQTLRARHHNIIRLLVQGFTHQAIADHLEVSVGMVSRTANSELGKQKILAMQAEADTASIDIVREFAELAPVALEVAEDIMVDNTEKASDRLNAVKVILQGAGHTGNHNRLDINVHHLTDEDIQAAKMLGRERGKVFEIEEGKEVEEAVILSENSDES
ncbi:hypothetical protein LCGC14_2761080 [marine sediment metagenome]|uniref:Uncharacterized protein n=1 Tax=marine sediment metagenome TaxID=412755 RepID=A0A0F9B7I9_9ZZZZ